MKNIKWLDSCQIQVEPTAKPKKITGTRFASILSLNPWNTPFQAWCQMTRTYEPPFEGNVYTEAGKTIEPKIINYLKLLYFGAENVVTPTDVYGENYFTKTWGDFYKDEPIFGGMWDALVKVDGEVKAVIEIKTTQRVEDWQDEAPLYYTMQAGLYAKLLGVDNFYMAVAFLEDKDYENPENFKPNSENILVKEYSLERDFPNFDYSMALCEEFYNEHIETGISPKYDEKKDEEYLKALKTTSVSPEESDDEILEELDKLQRVLEAEEERLKPMTERLEVLKAHIKNRLTEAMGDNETKAVIKGNLYSYELSKSTRASVDSKALERDGLKDKYSKVSTTYTLRIRKGEM